jgi:hypothetical protein
MLTLRCTHKLLKEPHLPKDELPDPADGIFGSWFGHLFRLERRKCVLFTNDRTRYSVLLFGLMKDDFHILGQCFLSGLTENLRNDGIPSETIASIGIACYPIAWGTTNSRSVLGTMNDMIMTSKLLVSTQRQDILAEVEYLNHQLNRTPISTLKYLRPINEFKNALENWTP